MNLVLLFIILVGVNSINSNIAINQTQAQSQHLNYDKDNIILDDSSYNDKNDEDLENNYMQGIVTSEQSASATATASDKLKRGRHVNSKIFNLFIVCMFGIMMLSYNSNSNSDYGNMGIFSENDNTLTLKEVNIEEKSVGMNYIWLWLILAISMISFLLFTIYKLWKLYICKEN